MIDIKFFNLLAHHHSQPPVSRKYLLPELYGFFELFQALSQNDSYFKQHSLFSQSSLATGFRETLSLLIKFRSQIDTLTIKNLVRIIYDFIKGHKTETEYHLILYETTVKIYRIEHLLRLKIDMLNTADTRVVKELHKIVVLRKGLTEVIIRAYLCSHIKLTFNEENELKDKTTEFVKRIILELQEEENILQHDGQGLAMKEYYHELEMSSVTPMSPEVSTIYRYLMRLIFEMCNQKQDPSLFTQVFKLTILKYPISKVIGLYASVPQPSLKAYYKEMLSFLGFTAANAKSEKLIYIITSQVNQTLVNPSARAHWKATTEACQHLLQSVYDAGKGDSSFMLMFYSTLSKDYIKTRIDNQPLYSQWVEIHRFMMHWTARLHRHLLKKYRMRASLEKVSDVTMQIWMFTMFDIDEILNVSKVDVEHFSLAFNILREPSERIYSNSFLTCDLILQQPVAYQVEPKIKKALRTYYPNYER